MGIRCLCVIFSGYASPEAMRSRRSRFVRLLVDPRSDSRTPSHRRDKERWEGLGNDAVRDGRSQR
jgi:hypothetical protein